jgi:hypothetical protein
LVTGRRPECIQVAGVGTGACRSHGWSPHLLGVGFGLRNSPSGNSRGVMDKVTVGRINGPVVGYARGFLLAVRRDCAAGWQSRRRLLTDPSDTQWMSSRPSPMCAVGGYPLSLPSSPSAPPPRSGGRRPPPFALRPVPVSPAPGAGARGFGPPWCPGPSLPRDIASVPTAGFEPATPHLGNECSIP